MRGRNLILALGLALLAGTSGFAQQEDPIRNPFDEMARPDSNRPGSTTDPAGDRTVPPRKQISLAPTGETVTSREEAEEIGKNFREALANYGDILGAERTATMRNLDRRVARNEQLLARHSGELARYRDLVRRARIDYSRQLLAARAMKRGGRLSEEGYARRARELAAEYSFRMKEFEKDIEFYRTESESTNERLETLQEEVRYQRMIVDDRRVDRRGQPKPPPNPLEELVRRIGDAPRFELKDIWYDEIR